MSQMPPTSAGPPPRFLFPAWFNYLMPVGLVLVVGGGLLTPVIVGLGAHPRTTDVGYQPVQPVPFSHAMHVGQLGMDCRYCHSTVERAAFAALPPTQTCLNCHAGIKADSPALDLVRRSYAQGTSIPWVKVHDLPDYAYFNHAAHVNKGVGCESCHGRVDQMETVFQAHTLSMAWCLECHRAPEKHLRPLDRITRMGWDPAAETGKSQIELGRELKAQYGIQSRDAMTSCSTCHR